MPEAPLDGNQAIWQPVESSPESILQTVSHQEQIFLPAANFDEFARLLENQPNSTFSEFIQEKTRWEA